MKILYGTQGTGNGHISRARAMARHLSARGAQVDYLFSGRRREDFFEMEAFGHFTVREGLSFAVEAGQVNYLKTCVKNNPLTFIRDVVQLDLAPYDVILCDFEPVTGWAGKLRNKQVIGFGHQPAFHYTIPMEGEDKIAKLVMKYFAPASVNIGLHWHHFNQPILPPIIHVDETQCSPVQENKILVYLPFDSEENFAPMLRQFNAFDFYLYHPDYSVSQDDGNLHKRPLSVVPFQDDLKTSAGVMCSAGFELPSECIQLGKKLLVKPIRHQMEQASNAVALVQLGLGERMMSFDAAIIQRWLEKPACQQQGNYPDVAAALVDWILAGDWQDYSLMQSRLWESVTFRQT